MDTNSKQMILQEAKDNNVKFIRLWFTDILGTLKSFAITVDELEDALDGGMGRRVLDHGLPGHRGVGHDRDARPSTFKTIPWSPQEAPTARMICDVRTPDGDPYVGDPRHVLRRALERASEMGFDNFFCGPELEYFYFRNSNGTEPLDYGGYFDLTTLDAATSLRRETVMALQELGIDVEYSHHEVGISQHEIDLRFDDALTMADKVQTYKTVVKEIATKHGVYATFMPKPIRDQNGSGMHTHQSLFSGDSNAFFDSNDQYFLSDTAKQFIAGQLRHAREISIIFAQFVNSTSAWSPAMKPLSTSPGAATARRWYGSRSTIPARRRLPERSSAAPIPPRTSTCASQRSCTRASRGSRRATSSPSRWSATSTTSPTKRGRSSVSRACPPTSARLSSRPRTRSSCTRPSASTFSRLLELKRAEFEDYRVQVTPYEIQKYLPIL